MVMKILQECERWTTGAIALIAACGSFVACAKRAGGKVYLVGESRVVSGIIGSQKGVDLKTLKVSLIDSRGFRSTPAELKYSPEQGQFSFQLRDSDLSEPAKGNLIDTILSMGNALPVVSSGEADLVGKVDRYARIELMQDSISGADFQVLPYFQATLPLSRRNLFAGKDTIGVDGQLSFSKAGFVRIKVVDAVGNPLAGIKVAGVADGKLASGVPLWHDSLLHPVFTTTGADGKAFIGPLDASVELTRYQILAMGDGFCTYLSSPSNNFSLVEKIAPVVKLRQCDPPSGNVNSLLPSFPDGLKYLNVNNRMVVHTNQDSVFLRLDSTTQKLRGARVAIYETNANYEPALEPTGEVREVTTFQSEFSMPLPKIFKISDSTEGKFIIKVSRIMGALDGPDATPDVYPELVVYGYKKVAVPSRDILMKLNLGVTPDITDGPTTPEGQTTVDDWINFKIASVSGHTNIVPGTAGGTFTMTSAFCGDGDALGFTIPAYQMLDPVFKDCVNGVATFTAEEAGFLTRAAKIVQYGGRQKWRIFIKDKFGNISENLEDPNAPSPKRLNVVTVIVDTGWPMYSNTSDGLQLAGLEFFKDTIDAAGKRAGSAKPVTPADLAAGALKMRFSTMGSNGDSTCLQTAVDDSEKNLNGMKGGNATLLGGVISFVYRDDLNRLVAKSQLYEDVGLMIYKWVIAGNSVAAGTATLANYTRCREADLAGKTVPVARDLMDGDLVFNTGGTADFYLRFMDVAGQFSNPIKYSIPACPVAPDTTTTLCWKN